MYAATFRFTFAGVRGTVAMCPMRFAIVIGVDLGRVGVVLSRCAMWIGGRRVVWVVCGGVVLLGLVGSVSFHRQCVVCHVMSCHVMSGQVRPGQARPGQVRSGQVRSCRVMSCHVSHLMLLTRFVDRSC